MQPHIIRAAEAFAALNAELYHAARGACTLPGDLDPFVMLAGPDLLRNPWLEDYYDRTMLHEIYTAMRGREELYSQVHDLLDLLSLQFQPDDTG